jgi:hypothetical protein
MPPIRQLTWVNGWAGTTPPQISAAVKWLAWDPNGLIVSTADARTAGVTTMSAQM